MAKKDRIAKLRDEFNAARRKGKWGAARDALILLARLEPDEPRWPHQLGEMLRRSGDTAGAVSAFESATQLYADGGFLARAVAMAKTLLHLDPSRTDVLERVDPSAAQRRHREARPKAISAPAAPRISIAAAAPVLEPAEDEADDEVRFVDLAEPSVIEIDISELELLVEAEDEEPSEPELDRLALMPSFPLFAELPADRLRVLAEGADLVELSPGEPVLALGEPADALYCIVDGSVTVDVPGLDQQPVLREGDVFGESCLLDAGVRGADVDVADEPLVALRIAREVLDMVVQGVPELDDLLFELLARRVLGNFLKTSPLFTVFSPKDRRELARRFEIRRAEMGTSLLVEGKRSDGLYAVVKGELEVGGRERGPGTIVGVASLFDREPARVTVTTTAECVLLRLPAAKLNAFVSQYPPALEHLAKIASREEQLAGNALS